MSNETFFQQLPVPLTEEELKQRGKDLAKTHQDIGEIERHKKEINDDFKAKISALEASTSSLSRAISNGYEYREVECEWAFFWEKGEKHMVRLDTGETVEIRKISDFERQERLPLDEPEQKKSKKKPKEEPEEDFPNEQESPLLDGEEPM